MTKKNVTSDTEPSLSLFGKIACFFKSETVHFIIGLVLVIFSVYLLLAFSSFFFTGAADQSIIDAGNAVGVEYIILEQDASTFSELESIAISMDAFRNFTGVEW